MKVIFTILAITVLGAILRIQNISPFKFYPDSYQNLIVARSIRNYHSVVGYLGENGMLYPDFFMWTRPVYPLFINLTDSILHNQERAAQLISLAAGILAIPLSFVFLRLIFAGTAVALSGAFITALSFNHTVWSGFIMSESMGVLAQLLFLILYFWGNGKKTQLLSLVDIMTGVFFTLAVFTRYEYAILTVPLVLYTLVKTENPLVRMVNFGISIAVSAAFFIIQLYPIDSMLQVVYKQHSAFLPATLAIIIVSVISYAVLRKIPAHTRNTLARFVSLSLILLLWILAAVFLLYTKPEGISNFFKDDPFLGVSALLGFTFLLSDRKNRSLALFAVFACLTLFSTYYRVNPLMQRYGTHLLPYLLIAAGSGLARIFAFAKIRLPVFALLVAVALLQLNTTAFGIKNWHKGVWMRPSYEEKSARIISDMAIGQDKLLLVSEPEPYYFFTGLSTHSLADKYPFIYINKVYEDRQVVLVQDMPMRDLFPEFSSFVTTNLTSYKTGEYWVGETYRYRTYGLDENKPVEIYTLPLSVLRTAIEAGNFTGKPL